MLPSRFRLVCYTAVTWLLSPHRRQRFACLTRFTFVAEIGWQQICWLAVIADSDRACATFVDSKTGRMGGLCQW